MGIQMIVVSRVQTSLPYEYQLSSFAMLNLCIIKQEDFVMFLYVTVFVLTALVCVSDSLFQSLLLELIGELLTTILIPYNILQGRNSLSHNILFFNRNIFRRQSNICSICNIRNVFLTAPGTIISNKPLPLIERKEMKNLEY